MKGLREFEIPYVGLKVGVHNFDYEIDRKFFDHFKDSPIQDCSVKVKLEFEKKETFFILKFFIDGNVNVECDRCLVPFNKSIFGDYTSYVKFSENADALQDEDEVLFIPREQTILDVSQLIYEYIILCLPMQRWGCKKPGEEAICNKEVLKYIAGEAAKTEETVDPRWAALKKLKN
ncbi:MAG: DUF177 domain-containing protein [Bacteroidetes bacterium]|nr:DUF177 domain-containing protein [Bacteroidota bacterium]MBK8657962.1 DUF177 domain-containing protein [Bacteroidota bacterium]